MCRKSLITICIACSCIFSNLDDALFFFILVLITITAILFRFYCSLIMVVIFGTLLIFLQITPFSLSFECFIYFSACFIHNIFIFSFKSIKFQCSIKISKTYKNNLIQLRVSYTIHGPIEQKWTYVSCCVIYHQLSNFSKNVGPLKASGTDFCAKQYMEPI